MGLVLALGCALMVLVACDAAVTVLHSDAEGLLAGGIRRLVWRVTAPLNARLPRLGRHALGLAGPVIIVLTCAGWLTLLVVGLALAVWPMLPGEFAAQTDLGAPTFTDALYFAGGTVAVLGFGDLTPLSGRGQLVTLAGAAAGFTMFTGIATYAIEIVGGITARNRFTLAVYDDVRGGGGATMVAEDLAEAGPDEVRERCRAWADHLRALDEMVHRYPLVAFTYRSHRDEYDPEPALRHVAEATVAALVAAEREPTLRTTAEALSSALARLQHTIADTYLDKGVVRRITDPEPTEEDRAAVARIDRLLSDRLGQEGPKAEHRSATETVHRCRAFLAGLHQWSRTPTPPHEWDGRGGVRPGRPG
ncbi:potassium channel family protein [Thermomonospora amylolytica]|uniref:potassium channel family protein n=1 Tax=Thermomonospora amylolytica TaxID=1411117 RepID=UPI000E6CE645|nr:potassium channel family protein [Thermomonospora amylolytica]